MSFYDRFFGKKTPTAADLAAVVERLESDVAAHEAEIARRDDDLKARAAELEPAAYVAMSRERDELVALLQQARDSIPVAMAAHTDAVAREADAALTARVEALRRRVKTDAQRALSAYDEAARKAADAIADYDAVCREVAKLNADLHAARREDMIEHPNVTYRKAPDEHFPERREMRAKWLVRNQWTGLEEEISIFRIIDGEKLPSDGHGGIRIDARKVEEEVVVERARTRPGRSLPNLAEDVVLPPARIGDAPIWPRPKKF